ncbi:hypothetical protein ASG17_14090 [Brevundimonas sp. Leaf363]|uniref:hypothetical protein n=1 Tax=Brevundimonas sp. Leaf363 TaxID=1736353 RepID=UPI0006F53E13|nr:hypothetical protein [Brevundimonas sp. Leaf363]KQS54069.1 hypothetical protein ASG17_14090 [Brevundimonas sp. Leaf363]
MTGRPRLLALAGFGLVAIWTGWRLIRIIDQISTSLFYMSAAGRTDAIVSAMVVSAFLAGVATLLALWVAWRGLKTGRGGRLVAGLAGAVLLPLLHEQVVVFLSRLAI